ncbi:MAG: hypothetical protein R3261_11350 [Alphaproteobacteria bacterium]|nr:hypothetical protein [Alphaproteobacteria bacterium]
MQTCFQQDTPAGEPLFSVDQLESIGNKKLYSWWSQQANNDIPCWDDFNILAFMKYADSLTMTERVSDKCFQFKIQGEKTLDLLGRNRLHKAVITPDHPEEYERELFSYYEMVCRTGLAHCYKGSIPKIGRDLSFFESVDLPFCDSNGQVNKILSILAELD